LGDVGTEYDSQNDFQNLKPGFSKWIAYFASQRMMDIDIQKRNIDIFQLIK